MLFPGPIASDGEVGYMLPVLNSGSRDSRETTDCVQLDVLNSNATDSATQVYIDDADVSETLEGVHLDATSKVTVLSAVDTLVYELADVSEEFTVPPIVAEHSARVARQLRLAGEELQGGTEPTRFFSKARMSVAERR